MRSPGFFFPEFRQRVIRRFERIGGDHLFPEPAGVERCAEQGVAGFGKEAVGQADIFQGPFGLPGCQVLHEAVQGFAAAVVVAGLAGFGERLLPKGDGCFKAVGAEVGQLNVNLFPFVCGAGAGKRRLQTVGCRGCGMRRQGGADCQEYGPGEGLRDNRAHNGFKKAFEEFCKFNNKYKKQPYFSSKMIAGRPKNRETGNISLPPWGVTMRVRPRAVSRRGLCPIPRPRCRPRGACRR